jgi:DNA-binding XRE family transcriptional regulator
LFNVEVAPLFLEQLLIESGRNEIINRFTNMLLFIAFFNFISNIGIFAYLYIIILHEFYLVKYIDNSAFLIEFGKSLRKHRRLKGFTQEQLANDLGVEISQISRIERGIINTSIGNVNAISKVLKINIKELFDF